MITLTATRRLARFLRRSHERAQLASGASGWTAAPAFPLQEWLRGVWLGAWPAALPLSPLQEQLLWEQQVKAAPLPGAVDVQASRAASAHRLLAEWCLGVPAVGGGEPLPRETRAFLKWRRGFLAGLAAGPWLDSVGVQAAAVGLLEAGQVAVPSEVRFAGFDEATPWLRQVEGVLARRGCQVGVRPADPSSAGDGTHRRVVRAVSSDPVHEARDLAVWCRGHLERDPSATVGVVVPHLERRWREIDRALRDELTPGAIEWSDPERRRPLHSLSLGASFSEHPIIAMALRLLGLSYPLDFADVVRLLRSPFLRGGASEAAARAALELEFRRARRVRATRQQCLDAARDLPALRRVFEALDAKSAGASAGRGGLTPAQWTEQFRDRLRAVGWPGQRTLNSAETQAVERFQLLLEEFAGADLLALTWDRGEALQKLREAAARVQFQARGGDEPVVHVLGVLEAGGLEFDHLWIAGMSDEGWPPRGAPHPLLPTSWQREHQLPHSSPQRISRFAHTLTQRLLASGDDIVVSRPQQIDGRDAIDSPFFAALPAADLQLPESVARIRQLAAVGAPLEVIPKEVPATLGAGEEVAGGVAVLADQAACGFRAFALHRLRARPLEIPDERIDPRERGELLHLALEHFWGDWRDHATLTERTKRERREAVTAAVAAAATEFLAGRDDLPEVFRRLEVRRAEEVVLAWLQAEEEREPFAVAELEQGVELEVGGVRLRGRLDRVDTLASGGRVVIDYKTGRSPTDAAWNGARPDQPQLPLYATHLDSAAVRGLAFAALSRTQLRFFGSSASAGVFPKVKAIGTEAEWGERVGEWRVVLDRLATAFREGQAVVDPKHVRKSCQRCHLQPLCRISERDPYFIPDEELHKEPETGQQPDRLRS